ncbi:putative glucose-6-phosphate 1-epimerase [Glycine soja]
MIYNFLSIDIKTRTLGKTQSYGHCPLKLQTNKTAHSSIILDWKKGKVNPFMSSIRARLRPRPMPLNIFPDMEGLPRIILTEATGSSAEVLLYGGQVVSWKNERKEELLFMSSKANWKQSKANRGGISVCFPQFGNLGSLEQHGSARNRLWSLDRDPSPLPPSDNQSSVDLIIKSTGVDLKNRPCSFEFRLRISLSAGKLILIPRVRNTDNKTLSFTLSISNYLSVSDISEVRVEGLETLDYLDNLLNRSRFTEQADAITFDGQMDRLYLRTPTKIAVIDHEKKRTFVLQKNAMPDAVIWNPGYRKAKALPDLGDADYKFMICVDSEAIETPLMLKPYEEWKGYQELSNVSSSYCSGQLDPSKVLYGFH